LVMLASLMVGGRMLLLARKTRALPELSLGLSLVLVFGVGYPAAVVQQQGEFSPVVHYGLRVVSGITVNTAFSMLLIFSALYIASRAFVLRILQGQGAFPGKAVFA